MSSAELIGLSIRHNSILKVLGDALFINCSVLCPSYNSKGLLSNEISSEMKPLTSSKSCRMCRISSHTHCFWTALPRITFNRSLSIKDTCETKYKNVFVCRNNSNMLFWHKASKVIYGEKRMLNMTWLKWMLRTFFSLSCLLLSYKQCSCIWN